MVVHVSFIETKLDFCGHKLTKNSIHVLQCCTMKWRFFLYGTYILLEFTSYPKHSHIVNVTFSPLYKWGIDEQIEKQGLNLPLLMWKYAWMEESQERQEQNWSLLLNICIATNWYNTTIKFYQFGEILDLTILTLFWI